MNVYIFNIISPFTCLGNVCLYDQYVVCGMDFTETMQVSQWLPTGMVAYGKQQYGVI